MASRCFIVARKAPVSCRSDRSSHVLCRNGRPAGITASPVTKLREKRRRPPLQSGNQDPPLRSLPAASATRRTRVGKQARPKNAQDASCSRANDIDVAERLHRCRHCAEDGGTRSFFLCLCFWHATTCTAADSRFSTSFVYCTLGYSCDAPLPPPAT